MIHWDAFRFLKNVLVFKIETIYGLILNSYNNMDGTGEHYGKWNKPGGEGQIPYDLTFNWSIINKRKKQTKYTQRHWN